MTNLHNFGGHCKALIRLFLNNLPREQIPVVYRKMADITGVPTNPIDGAEFTYYRYRHWRRLSLHLDVLFKNSVSEKYRNAVSVLFELLNEIHIFNYWSWNRRDCEFSVMKMRYFLVVFMYANQLRNVFSPEQVQELDDIYLHKILIHSLKVFMFVNLNSGCETREGLIHTLNILFKYTTCSLDKASKRVLLMQILKEEERFTSQPVKKRESFVFFNNFIEKYNPKPIKVLLPRDQHETFLTYIGELCEQQSWSTILRHNRERRKRSYTFKARDDLIMLRFL